MLRYRGAFVRPKLKCLFCYTEEKQVTVATKKACHNALIATEHPFKNIFLAINFNHPKYKNIAVLEEYYQPIFPNRLYCGPELEPTGKYPFVVIDQAKPEYGYYGYQCLVEAVRRHPGYNGYLYVNDDMIVNWWNFLKLDYNKIWYERPPVLSYIMGTSPIPFWFRRVACGERCTKSFNEMKNSSSFKNTDMFKIFYKNTNNSNVCLATLSDFFYVPGRFAERFMMIGQKFYDNRLFLEIAIPMALYMLDYKENITFVNGLYLQRIYGWSDWTKNTTRAWQEYNYEIFFLHPYKFVGANQTKNTGEFKERVGRISNSILNDRCLDILKEKLSWRS